MDQKFLLNCQLYQYFLYLGRLTKIYIATLISLESNQFNLVSQAKKIKCSKNKVWYF